MTYVCILIFHVFWIWTSALVRFGFWGGPSLWDPTRLGAKAWPCWQTLANLSGTMHRFPWQTSSHQDSKLCLLWWAQNGVSQHRNQLETVETALLFSTPHIFCAHQWSKIEILRALFCLYASVNLNPGHVLQRISFIQVLLLQARRPEKTDL